jgi:hypothetical protein
MELMSIEGVVDVVDDKSELTAEVELIAFTCLHSGKAPWRHAYP